MDAADAKGRKAAIGAVPGGFNCLSSAIVWPGEGALDCASRSGRAALLLDMQALLQRQLEVSHVMSTRLQAMIKQGDVMQELLVATLRHHNEAAATARAMRRSLSAGVVQAASGPDSATPPPPQPLMPCRLHAVASAASVGMPLGPVAGDSPIAIESTVFFGSDLGAQLVGAATGAGPSAAVASGEASGITAARLVESAGLGAGARVGLEQGAAESGSNYLALRHWWSGSGALPSLQVDPHLPHHQQQQQEQQQQEQQRQLKHHHHHQQQEQQRHRQQLGHWGRTLSSPIPAASHVDAPVLSSDAMVAAERVPAGCPIPSPPSKAASRCISPGTVAASLAAVPTRPHDVASALALPLDPPGVSPLMLGSTGQPHARCGRRSEEQPAVRSHKRPRTGEALRFSWSGSGSGSGPSPFELDARLVAECGAAGADVQDAAALRGSWSGCSNGASSSGMLATASLFGATTKSSCPLGSSELQQPYGARGRVAAPPMPPVALPGGAFDAPASTSSLLALVKAFPIHHPQQPQQLGPHRTDPWQQHQPQHRQRQHYHKLHQQHRHHHHHEHQQQGLPQHPHQPH